jgi:hypothetical protein
VRLSAISAPGEDRMLKFKYIVRSQVANIFITYGHLILDNEKVDFFGSTARKKYSGTCTVEGLKGGMRHLFLLVNQCFR